MQPVEITYFTVTLFFALVALIQWKRRRNTLAERLNRGLRGYIAGKTGRERPARGVTVQRASMTAPLSTPYV